MNTPTTEWDPTPATPNGIDEWIAPDRHGIGWHVLVERQYPTMLAEVRNGHHACPGTCVTVAATVTATFDGYPLPRLGHDDPLGQVHRRGLHYDPTMDRADMWLKFVGEMADQARHQLWEHRGRAISALQIEAHRVRELRVAVRTVMRAIAPDGQGLSEVGWGDPL